MQAKPRPTSSNDDCAASYSGRQSFRRDVHALLSTEGSKRNILDEIQDTTEHTKVQTSRGMTPFPFSSMAGPWRRDRVYSTCRERANRRDAVAIPFGSGMFAFLMVATFL